MELPGWGKDAPFVITNYCSQESWSGSWEWKSWTYLSLAAALGRVGLAPHLGSATEQTLLPWSQVIWPHKCAWEIWPHLSSVLWVSGGGRYVLPIPCPLQPVVGGRSSPEVMKVRELVLPLTSWITQHNGPCVSLRQQNRADHVGWGAGEPVQGVWGQESWPCPPSRMSAMWCHERKKGGNMLSSLPLPSIAGRRPGLGEHNNGRAGPVPHLAKQ